MSRKNSLALLACCLGIILTVWFVLVSTPDSIDRNRVNIQRNLYRWRVGPHDADPRRWDAAWLIVYNGSGNVCYNDETITVSNAAKLDDSIASLTQSPPTWNGLREVWSQIADAGDFAGEYTHGRTHQLENLLPQPSNGED